MPKPIKFKPKKDTKPVSPLRDIPKVKPATREDIEREQALAHDVRVVVGNLSEDATDFESLLQHRGWHKVVFIANENARILGEQILNKISTEGTKLEESDCDRLREQREAILEFIKKPKEVVQQYADFLKSENEGEENDGLDPYGTAKDEPEHLKNP